MTLPRFPARFEQVEELSSTPLERTFRAVDTLLQREVLLRLPPVEAWSGWSADVRLRLLREAQALAKIQHDGVASVLWVEEIEDGLLVVQNPPAGERLGEALKHGAMTVDAVVDLGIELGRALAAVHFANVVHRGVGVDAVWILPNGRARLGAFHFAKALDARLGGSSLNHGLRKKSGADEEAAWLPPYSAPEQLAGKSADARADVFALGCLMFRCLTGHDPLLAVEGGQMPDVRSARKDVPKAVADVVRRCMLVEKTARFPTAQAVAEALEAGKVSGGGGGSSSRRGVLSAVAAVVLVGGAAMWFGGGSGSDIKIDRDSDSVAGHGGEYERSKVAYSRSYAKGHALLIGIGDRYRGTPYAPLVTPVAEVRAVAQRLKQVDPQLWTDASVEVLQEADATAKKIGDKLRRLQESAQKDDCILVYFAGHGQKLDGSDGYWLVANDAQDKYPSPAGSIGYVADTALTDLRNSEAKHVLVVLDCCYAGRVGDRLFAGERDLGRAPECDDDTSATKHELDYCSHRARQWLLSTSKDKTAADGTDGLSPFCREFLAALTPLDPKVRYVTAGMVKEQIAARVKGAQLPVLREFDFEDNGTFVFFLPGK